MISAKHTQPRSEETRQRVIKAAIESFGRQGFAGTSTRELAAGAGTNITAIHYHFRGKDGLYRAAAEHIAKEIKLPLAALIEKIQRTQMAPDVDRQSTVNLICELFDGFAIHVLTDKVPDSWARFIMREQLEPTEAFEVLFAAMKPFLETASKLVRKASIRRTSQSEAHTYTLMIIGEILIFRTARSAAQRILNWKTIGRVELRQLRRGVRRSIVSMLEGSGELL